VKRAALIGLVLVLVACGGEAATAPSPSGSPLPQASGRLGAQVPMPVGFPVDVPVYPKARLTAAAGFPEAAPTSWGMEWQSLDGVATVQTFYRQKLNQGDWTLTVASSAPSEFKATFGRKSDASVIGTLDVTATSGTVTKILMSLVTA
jgi:hypothetical protein